MVAVIRVLVFVAVVVVVALSLFCVGVVPECGVRVCCFVLGG